MSLATAAADTRHVPLGEEEGQERSSKDHAPLGLKEEEENVVESEGEEVGKLLRATVEDLESALEDTRQLLATRDHELQNSKQELERYKQQAAREIANKTRLAQALDQSQSHVGQLEELLQNWQLQLRQLEVQGERLQSALKAEQDKNQELESHLALMQEQEKELETARSELEECKLQLQRGKLPWQHSSAVIDGAQQLFLKQAVLHLLTDFHAEEQLRAIVSILDFNAQERKAVYSKMQEKGGFYR